MMDDIIITTLNVQCSIIIMEIIITSEIQNIIIKNNIIQLD